MFLFWVKSKILAKFVLHPKGVSSTFSRVDKKPHKKTLYSALFKGFFVTQSLLTPGLSFRCISINIFFHLFVYP
jgi:hypothetical protein